MRAGKRSSAASGGFALGVVVAFFAFRAGDVAIEGLGELSCVIAIIVVAAFSLYGADDSETEDALLVLMTASAECPPSIDLPKNASPFRDRCRAIAEQYDLSPREARETRRGVGEDAASTDSVLH